MSAQSTAKAGYFLQKRSVKERKAVNIKKFIINTGKIKKEKTVNIRKILINK